MRGEGQRVSGWIHYIENPTKNYPGDQGCASFALEKLKLKLNIVYGIESILLIILEGNIGSILLMSSYRKFQECPHIHVYMRTYANRIL